jgi:hypothetical protein
MISIDNKSAKQTLDHYLLHYRDIFNKRSFLLFKWLIAAILCIDEVRSIQFLYDNFIRKYFKKSLNSFYYFLSYLNFSCEALLITTVKISLSLIPQELQGNSTIFLTIDDTLQAKSGKHFDCYYKLFDHSAKNGTSYLNGHCFVSLIINIPLLYGSKVRYLSIPISYKLYDKQQSKYEIAASMIHIVMPLLAGFQVILLCDSWYPKGKVIDAVKSYDNLQLICAVRSDTALYDLPPAPTGNKGRPRKYGDKINVKELHYQKIGQYYMASKVVLTNLFETQPITVIVTVKNLEKFESARVYISTVTAQDIHVFKKHTVLDVEYCPENPKLLPYFVYSLRWNIEVMFYEHKFFWSFGNYMLRNQNAIERYVNLLSISFAFVQVLPFINENYRSNKFKSPQAIKRVFGDRLNQELIFDIFMQQLEKGKIYATVKNAVNTFLGLDNAA